LIIELRGQRYWLPSGTFYTNSPACLALLADLWFLKSENPLLSEHFAELLVSLSAKHSFGSPIRRLCEKTGAFYVILINCNIDRNQEISLRRFKPVLIAKNLCEILKRFVLVDVDSLDEGFHVLPLLSRHFTRPFVSRRPFRWWKLWDNRNWDDGSDNDAANNRLEEAVGKAAANMFGAGRVEW
jgi:hypothetical protein